MLVLHMTEDGKKVVRFEEFVDSKYSAEFMPRLREHLAGKQKKALGLMSAQSFVKIRQME